MTVSARTASPTSVSRTTNSLTAKSTPLRPANKEVPLAVKPPVVLTILSSPQAVEMANSPAARSIPSRLAGRVESLEQ